MMRIRKNIMKYAITVLLAVTMLLSMVPMSAFALPNTKSFALLSQEKVTYSSGIYDIFTFEGGFKVEALAGRCMQNGYVKHQHETTVIAAALELDDNSTLEFTMTYKIECDGTTYEITNTSNFGNFSCENLTDMYTWSDETAAGEYEVTSTVWLEREAGHSGTVATCLTPAPCTVCGTSYTNANNHEKPDEFTYSLNADDSTRHDKKYACCGGFAESLVHGEYTYSASGNVLTKTCGLCGHAATATLTAADAVYTGSAITTGASITYGEGWAGNKPQPADIAETKYTDNVNAGHAKVTTVVEGKELTASFKINTADISGAQVFLSEKYFTYNNQPQKPADVYVTFNDIYLTEGVDYELYYKGSDNVMQWENGEPTKFFGTAQSESIKAGKYYAVVYGKGNFTEGGSFAYADYTIYKATPQYTVPMNITATYGDTLEDVDLPGGWSWKDPTASVGDVGTKTFKAIFTPDDTANYDTAEVDVPVTVYRRSLSAANVTLSQTEFTYNGNAQTPTVAVTYNGIPLAEHTDYTLIWSADCTNVGNKTVTVTFMGNFSGQVTLNFEIKKAPLTVTANNKTITYGENPSNSGVSYDGFVSSETEAVLGGTLGYDYSYTQYGDVGTYDIIPSGLTSDNYEITFVKGKLKVEPKEIGISWGATEFMPYTGQSIVPEATATGLVNGDVCTLTVSVVETTEGAGIIPGRYHAKVTALSNDNYCLPASGNLVEVEYGIVKGYVDAPVVSGVSETVKGKADGKITGLTTAMEYSTEFTADDDKYTQVTDADMSFAPGTYYVRYQAAGYYNASTFTEVTIGEGGKLKVTIPQNQTGHTLTVDKTALDWQEEVTLTYTLKDGYTELSNFAVEVNGTPVTLTDGKYTVTDPEEDIEITVKGVADVTAPTAELEVAENKWTSFWNNITFGLLFKDTQNVTIKAADNGSGIKSIEYYLASGELELDEVRAITDWEGYNGTFKIKPNNCYVVYVKVSDHAGNTVYVNSDGITLDNVAPTLEGIENGKTYYGDLTVVKSEEQFYDIKTVTLDGVPMSFEEGTYGIIPADNKEHTVVAEDHVGNKTVYTVTVYKNYTVTYKADGKVVDTVTVGHGKDAAAPAIPAKEGYDETAPKWDKNGKNITADTEINAVYTKNQPGEYADVTPDTNVGGAKLAEEISVLKEKIPFTKEEEKQIEHGADVKIWLEINDISASVSAEDKAKIEEKLGDGVVAMYLDISIFKQVGKNEAYNLEQLDDKVMITLKLDDSYINTDKNVTRTYSIIHVHDGKVEIITPVFNATAKTLSFMTDRFSTYAVVYTDEVDTPPAEKPAAPDESPATGDSSYLWLWAVILVVAAAAFAIIVVIRRKKIK